jgi:membrane protein implicated in regulation of membrane protease activity
VRRLSLIAGIGLVALAFGAATRVADTREGLIAEVITLLAGFAGVSLVLTGLFASGRPATRQHVQRAPPLARRPSTRDFTLGASGLLLATILIGGLAVTAGWQWAALGLVLLLPMIAGSAFLCRRFLKARGQDLSDQI